MSNSNHRRLTRKLLFLALAMNALLWGAQFIIRLEPSLVQLGMAADTANQVLSFSESAAYAAGLLLGLFVLGYALVHIKLMHAEITANRAARRKG